MNKGPGRIINKAIPSRSLVLAASLSLLAVSSPAAIAESEGPTVVATINLGANPFATAFDLAVNPNTNKTYVTPGVEFRPGGSECESQIVSVIDNSTNSVLTPITTGFSPFGVAVNPRTNKIYVANIGDVFCPDESPTAPGTVSVINGATDTVEETITVGLGPAFIAVNPNTNKIYTTISGGFSEDGSFISGNTVAVIDGSTNTVLHYVEVPPDPFVVAVNPRTNLVYVTRAGEDEITVIDGATDTVKTTFSIGSEARAIAFDPNGKFVYVAARNTNRLAVVDATTNAVVQSIPVGGRPHGVAVTNGRIYVANRGGCNSTPGTVSVIHARKLTLLATVQVGTCPRFLDVNPETGLLYVPNAASSRSVSVIRDDG